MHIDTLKKELNFKGIRSSGAGGQHVNKVSSKIELTFDVQNSASLTEDEKILLYKTIANKLTKENVVILFCDESRSQHKNKELAIKRFLELITLGLKKPKVRKATKPSKASIRRKAESKMKASAKKSLRRKPDLE